MGKIQGSKWKCPNCGRVFSRKDQAHYCGKPKTVDEYIAAQEEDVRSRLEEVRAVIRWSMPTYWKGRNLIHFAASKKHVGIYPGGEATTVFAKELAGIDVSKGTIRLPYGREVPRELIARIAKWCYAEYGK